jgi:hypothetical protein
VPVQVNLNWRCFLQEPSRLNAIRYQNSANRKIVLGHGGGRAFHPGGAIAALQLDSVGAADDLPFTFTCGKSRIRIVARFNTNRLITHAILLFVHAAERKPI